MKPKFTLPVRFRKLFVIQFKNYLVLPISAMDPIPESLKADLIASQSLIGIRPVGADKSEPCRVMQIEMSGLSLLRPNIPPALFAKMLSPYHPVCCAIKSILKHGAGIYSGTNSER